MKNKNFYKSLLETVEKQLNEISQQELETTNIVNYLKTKTSKQFNQIFENVDRIAIPFEQDDFSSNPKDSQLLGYINKLREQGWTIDLNEPFGYATKVVESKVGDKVYQNKKKVKIGPLIIALGKEAEKFWQENNKFYTTKENQFYFRNKYSIIISRVPIDILRMSDHDNWTSCHSVSGGYFKCAVSESVEGGAVAYVVKQEELEKINLADPEIFKDKERNIDGVSPISRLRIRRVVLNQPDPVEIGIPEKRVYGQNFPGFYKKLASFLEEKQRTQIDKIKDKFKNNLVDLNKFKVYGGSYYDRDGTIKTLFHEFFGNLFRTKGNIKINKSGTEEQYAVRRFKLIENNHNSKSKFSNINVSQEEDEYDKDHIQEVCDVTYTVDIMNSRVEEILNYVNMPGNFRSIRYKLDLLFQEFTNTNLSSYVDVKIHKIESNKMQIVFKASEILDDVEHLKEISDNLLNTEKKQKKFIDKIMLSILSTREINLEVLKNNLSQVKNFIPESLELDGALRYSIKSKDITLHDGERKYNEILNLLDSYNIPEALKNTILIVFRESLQHYTDRIVELDPERYELIDHLFESFINSSRPTPSRQLSLFETKQRSYKSLRKVLDLQFFKIYNAKNKVNMLIVVRSTTESKYNKLFTDFVLYLDENIEIIKQYYFKFIDGFYDSYIEDLKESLEYYKTFKVWKDLENPRINFIHRYESRRNLTRPALFENKIKNNSKNLEKNNKLFYLDGNTWRIVK